MRRVFLATLLGSGFLVFPKVGLAGDFVSSVPQYSEGSFATVSGEHFTDTDGAIGKPSDIVDPTSAFAGILSPFEAHFEQDQLTAIGLGGSITLQFPNPLSVSGTPQVGIFTNVFFLDNGGGSTGSTTTTGAMDEFGAERSAVVSVASDPNHFHTIGRFVFANPTNYYANATDPYEYPAPNPAVPASFDQPFLGTPSSFNNDDFAGVLATLNGSAGGTWITIPTNLGLSQIQYVQLSDTEWELPNGTLVDQEPSKYYPDFNGPGLPFLKPADLFVDGAILIPEPAGIAVLIFTGALCLRKRRSVDR